MLDQFSALLLAMTQVSHQLHYPLLKYIKSRDLNFALAMSGILLPKKYPDFPYLHMPKGKKKKLKPTDPASH
jgi:hypothetical protein